MNQSDTAHSACGHTGKMSDPLVRVPEEKWLELKSVLDKDWPRCVQSETLDIHKKWSEKGFKHELEVFCPFGDFNNGMVAINSKISSYEVIILCPSDDTGTLEEALKKTKAVDWSKTVELAFCPQNTVDCVKRILDDVNVKILWSSKLNMLILPKGSPKFNICMPVGLHFGPLKKEHIELINDVWPHKYENSISYFDFFIETNSGYGLYYNEDLLGWAFVRENGCLLHVYVVKEHRRRGYGELIIHYLSNELLDCNKDVVAYCVYGNDIAFKMYQKSGFINYGLVEFYNLTRIN